jgi:hypothetical protein
VPVARLQSRSCSALIVTIPMRLGCRGGRTLIITPEGARHETIIKFRL